MKKSIAADALAHAFREELFTMCGNGHLPAIAIVPIPEQGWAALMSNSDRKRYPQIASHIAKIERKMRLLYLLQED